MLKLLFYKIFRLEEPPCQSCETLKLQLSIANHEKEQMLNTILSFSKPPEETPVTVNYESVKPKMVTWNVRRQMLEAEDRKAAQILADQRKKEQEQKQMKSVEQQISDLEKQVGIEEGVKSDA